MRAINGTIPTDGPSLIGAYSLGSSEERDALNAQVTAWLASRATGNRAADGCVINGVNDLSGHESDAQAFFEFLSGQPTPTEGKERADLGTALAVMRRREADAVRDMIALRQRVYSLEADLAAARAATSDTTVAWGPNHPQWVPFWAQAAADATAAGNCSEYDRHAREMGGPDRYSSLFSGYDLQDGRTSRQSEHSVRATVTITETREVYVTVTTDGDRPGWSDVSDALSESGELDDVESYEVSDYDVEDSEITDEGSPRYWPVR